MHFSDQLAEEAFLILEKLLWVIELENLSFSQDEDFVWLNNGLETMSNRDDCAMLELLRNESLDLLLSDDVDVSSGFIKQNDLVFTQDCPTDADQLLLSWAQVSSVLCYLKVEFIFRLLIFLRGISSFEPIQEVLETSFNKKVLDLIIGHTFLRVNIKSQCACE